MEKLVLCTPIVGFSLMFIAKILSYGWVSDKPVIIVFLIGLFLVMATPALLELSETRAYKRERENEKKIKNRPQ